MERHSLTCDSSVVHASKSNLLPSLPTPTNLALASRIGSRRVTHRPGDSVEELSGGTGTGVAAELSPVEPKALRQSARGPDGHH